MRIRRSLAVISVILVVLLAGCSGSSSTASSTTSTAAPPTTTADPCRSGYQAAASKLNSVARKFSQAAQNGQMNEQFAAFAGEYVQAMKTFDTSVMALSCPDVVRNDLAALVAAQTTLEPLVAQFAAGQRPAIPEFNAAASAVADAVKKVNSTLGITQ